MEFSNFWLLCPKQDAIYMLGCRLQLNTCYCSRLPIIRHRLIRPPDYPPRIYPPALPGYPPNQGRIIRNLTKIITLVLRTADDDDDKELVGEVSVHTDNDDVSPALEKPLVLKEQ